MTDDLLAGARAQAERSKPLVRAAAFLRIARVETAFDREKARHTFEQALDETRRLSGRDGQFLLEQAQLVAAAVAPDLVREIASGRTPRQFAAEKLGRVMLEHQHGDAALAYLMAYDEPSTFPFGVGLALMEWFGDEERRLAIFRRAIEAWRAAPNDIFIWLFHSRWKDLPVEEARDVARDIVRVALEQPDQEIKASYDQEETIQITSSREHTLFQILDVLRHVDGALAESLMADHEQLAVGARRFPNGLESVSKEAEARRTETCETDGGGFFMLGSPSEFPYLEALMQASRDGDFGPPLEHALEQYRDDTAAERPNQAPQEFWPSTCSFRGILYSAGNRLGRDAALYLDRIPDPDLRLFAQIELAAALAGLPELQGTRRECA